MNSDLEPDAVGTARRRAAAADRAVVKAGTNSLTDEQSRLDEGKVDALVDEVMTMIDAGTDVLLVSSGAIGAGIGRVGNGDPSVEESQALSTVGQPHLMRRYTESFERYDRKTAQLLLTQQDLEHSIRFRNLQNTVTRLLEWGIVPIINENDAVATDEIRIGDNDMLSSSVAIGMDADLLVTLTDVGGVYTKNPKENDDAEHIEAVGRNYAAVQDAIDGDETASFGGIQTKVAGAREVSEHGKPAIIARSDREGVLKDIVNGKAVGTIFVPMTGEPDE